MAIDFHLFSPPASARPRLACELMPNGVLAARQTSEAAAQLSFAPLPEGALTPGVKMPNVLDPVAVSAALRKALDEVAMRERQITLIVPDAATRVLLVDFDTLPTRVKDALPIVRFRLRKLLPFDSDDAAVSYQVLAQRDGQYRALVTAMPLAVRAEYEAAVQAAGYETGAMLPSTLAVLAGSNRTDPTLIVNHNGSTVTTAITDANDLLLHRTVDLPADPDLLESELAQTISVSVAYFEDTLQHAPDTLYYAGAGGARRFRDMLGSAAPIVSRIIDLAPAPGAPLPPGINAGVTGALAN